MSHDVIDFLEFVEVDKKHGQSVMAAFGIGQLFLKMLDEFGAIAKARKGVRGCEMGKFLGVSFFFADLALKIGRAEFYTEFQKLVCFPQRRLRHFQFGIGSFRVLTLLGYGGNQRLVCPAKPDGGHGGTMSKPRGNSHDDEKHTAERAENSPLKSVREKKEQGCRPYQCCAEREGEGLRRGENGSTSSRHSTQYDCGRSSSGQVQARKESRRED